MNAIKEMPKLMVDNLTYANLSSYFFTSLPQAISCANKFFMEGLNAQIVAQGNSSFLVVTPDIARQMHEKGFRLLYGN
ncbi:hypothetical protein GCM10027347_12750 [Larkinella harenae]